MTFDVEEHLPLLRRWLRQPHVVRWWGEAENNIAEALQRPAGGGHALISSEGTPVGYLCWQPYSSADMETVGEQSAVAVGAIDVDLMIGDPDHLGRGVGPSALQLLLTELGRDPRVRMVGVCTSIENTRAVRAFEKVGFARRRAFDDPKHGRCWFMVRASEAPQT